MCNMFLRVCLCLRVYQHICMFGCLTFSVLTEFVFLLRVKLWHLTSSYVDIYTMHIFTWYQITFRWKHSCKSLAFANYLSTYSLYTSLSGQPSFSCIVFHVFPYSCSAHPGPLLYFDWKAIPIARWRHSCRDIRICAPDLMARHRMGLWCRSHTSSHTMYHVMKRWKASKAGIANMAPRITKMALCVAWPLWEYCTPICGDVSSTSSFWNIFCF